MSTSSRRPPAWHIAIAGGGVPSLALALALRHGARDAVQVLVADPAGEGRADRRAYAVSPGSRAMLETLGVWTRVASVAQPIRSMRITDSREADAIRPEYLRFGGEAAEPLSFMLEGERLATILRETCRDAGVSLVAETVGSPELTPSAATFHLGGETRRASLLVAADGARSRLREAAGIGWVGRRYPQRALVATVSHERDHGGVAIQHFLPAGPFAILPLTESGGTFPFRSSIVWTEDERHATALLADPDRADEDLAARFGTELGAIRRDTPLGSFPLGVGLARRFVATRFALFSATSGSGWWTAPASPAVSLRKRPVERTVPPASCAARRSSLGAP
jgi:2-octaprenyl-6-methoxyphenol hydroxylase